MTQENTKEWGEASANSSHNHFMGWDVQGERSYYRCLNKCNFIDGEKTFADYIPKSEITEALEKLRSNMVAGQNFSERSYDWQYGYNEANEKVLLLLHNLKSKLGI